MRFSTHFGASETENHLAADNETRGVTIDVMMGIIAGIALVLAILMLASSLSSTPAAAAMLNGVAVIA